MRSSHTLSLGPSPLPQSRFTLPPSLFYFPCHVAFILSLPSFCSLPRDNLPPTDATSEEEALDTALIIGLFARPGRQAKGEKREWQGEEVREALHFCHRSGTRNKEYPYSMYARRGRGLNGTQQ